MAFIGFILFSRMLRARISSRRSYTAP